MRIHNALMIRSIYTPFDDILTCKEGTIMRTFAKIVFAGLTAAAFVIAGLFIAIVAFGDVIVVDYTYEEVTIPRTEIQEELLPEDLVVSL